jgi:hypothetical protein
VWSRFKELLLADTTFSYIYSIIDLLEASDAQQQAGGEGPEGARHAAGERAGGSGAGPDGGAGERMPLALSIPGQGQGPDGTASPLLPASARPVSRDAEPEPAPRDWDRDARGHAAIGQGGGCTAGRMRHTQAGFWLGLIVASCKLIRFTVYELTGDEESPTRVSTS